MVDHRIQAVVEALDAVDGGLHGLNGREVAAADQVCQADSVDTCQLVGGGFGTHGVVMEVVTRVEGSARQTISERSR